MPEGVGYGPQFTASVGKNLNYIGRHVYAYSGEVSVANTETNLLDFRTGKEYIIGEIQVGSKAGENEDYEFKIYLNDAIVFSHLFNSQGSNTAGEIANFVPIIIPPLTSVKISLDNIADTDTRVWTVGFTGQVHK